MKKLNGKIALITGGTSGIGLATAKLFQEEGANVIVTGTNEENIKQTRVVLGDGALVIQSDVSQLAELDKLFETIKSKFGLLDIVFANAGIANFVPVDQVSEEFYSKVMDVNVKGLYFTVQKSLPLLRKGGSVILTGSSLNIKGRPGGSVYGASKAAVRSLGRGFASEFVEHGIRVNVLSPGPVETPIFEKMGLSKEKLEATYNAYRMNTPVKRMGKPEEIAKVALFLASDDSSFLLGAEIYADGGVAQL